MPQMYSNKSGKEAVKDALKQVNRRFDGCKGVSCPNDETYFLAVEKEFGKGTEIALSLANKLKDIDQDYRLGLKLDSDRRMWNIAVDFPPFSEDLGGVVK